MQVTTRTCELMPHRNVSFVPVNKRLLHMFMFTPPTTPSPKKEAVKARQPM